MSSTNFVVHDSTGRIQWTGSCDSACVGNQAIAAGTTALDTGATAVVQNSNYVSGGFVTARPGCPVSASVAARVVTLTGVPVGSTVTVSGSATLTETATDTTVALTFGAAGTYNVAVGCFPALDYAGSFTLT